MGDFGRRYELLEAQGEKAVSRWNHPRQPEWLTAQAREAGIGDFDIVGKSGLSAENPAAGPGIWIVFKKVAA